MTANNVFGGGGVCLSCREKEREKEKEEGFGGEECEQRKCCLA